MSMTTLTATVSAGSTADASARVAKHIAKVAGLSLTGAVAVRSAKHNLYSVEILNAGGDANDAWVVLTSYGMDVTGSGSAWESTKGLGA